MPGGPFDTTSKEASLKQFRTPAEAPREAVQSAGLLWVPAPRWEPGASLSVTGGTRRAYEFFPPTQKQLSPHIFN